jgi:hypothetical protein
LSCDFERISGTEVGIAIKPEGVSVVTEPKSTEAFGTLTTTVDVGEANVVNLVFYSNYSTTERPSTCKFTNIVCRLADMEVEPGTEGQAEEVYTLNENGGCDINVPKYSPVLIYNPDNLMLYVEYSKDINKHFDSFVPRLTELDVENSNLREYYIADGQVLNTTNTFVPLADG